MNFLAAPKVMSISVNLTISGINNETTFEDELRSALENIIADITNSSASTCTFLEMLSNNAVINATVNPRDSPHEAFVISRMNAPKHFLKELNLGLQNLGLKIKPIVITVGQITPFPGTLIYIIRLHKFYNITL